MIRQDWSTLKKLMFMKEAAGGGSAAVERTATGNPLTFVTDLARPLKSLLIPFTPKQSGTGDPSPSNIRSIIPWNGLNVEHFDENLLAINRTSAQSTQGMTYTPIKQNNVPVAVKVEGTRTNVNPFFNLNYITKTGGGAGIAIPPGTYKIFGGTAEVRFQVFYHDANGVERLAGYDDGSGETVTIPADCTDSWCRLLTWVDTPVDTVIYPIILSADSSVTVYPVSFPSPVYGGNAEINSGALSGTWGAKKVKDIEWTYNAQNTRFVGTIDDIKLYPSVRTTPFYASVFVSVDDGRGISSVPNNAVYGGTNSTTIYVKCEDYTDPEDFVTAYGEQVICYPFATPQEQTLTGHQITAIVGDNTIWSDADGSLTAVYLMSSKYAEEHPVGGLSSGLGSGLLGSGAEDPEEPIEDPEENPEE